MSFKNDRLIKTIYREPVDATPIWIMRQAGRYLPEYRAIRQKAGSFLNLCKTPELACEVTLQPLNRFPLDAAILFSDILTIPDALGLELQVIEEHGPQFNRAIRTANDMTTLGELDVNHLAYVYETICLVQRELAAKVPLIGFCGSPWTLAAYVVEGKSQVGFPSVFKMLQEEPELLHQLLIKLTTAIVLHLDEQIKAGVDVVMIFDTWGGLLNTENYEIFSLTYINQIITKLREKHYNHQKKIPIILFTKEGHHWLSQMMTTGCDVIGLDWEISLNQARKQVHDQVALQGNMHPKILLESEETMKDVVSQILAAYGTGSGHIFNLGHGITPEVDPEKVGILVDFVHELSRAYHR